MCHWCWVMEKPALEQVLQALDALYHHDNPLEKLRASQWLTQLQTSVSRSNRRAIGSTLEAAKCFTVLTVARAIYLQFPFQVHAWEVADQLLVLQRDIETSYFAAQTMQSKIRHCFAELPEDTHTVSLHKTDTVNGYLAPLPRLCVTLCSTTSTICALPQCRSPDR